VNVGVPGSRRAQGAPLSVREREILGLLAGGDSGAQIAQALVLSPETVRTHIRNAMSRWNQTDFESQSKKEAARKKIVAAAHKHGIEIADDDKIAKPVH